MSKSTPTKKKPLQPSAPRWTPHGYQRKAVKFLLEHGAAALFLDPGLGKTSITLAALKVLKREGTLTGALVVAPLRPARTTWPNEVAEWADFSEIDLVVLHGKDKDKLAHEKHDVYVVNYEGLSSLFTFRKVGKAQKPELTSLGKALLANVNTLVWDELSKMKNPGTQRYKLVKPWLRKFDRRWGLTGSPASNGLLDLFGQCYVLDEGAALGQYITHYKTAYFLPADTMGWTWRLKEGAQEAIQERLRPLALRMDADDYLKLPQLLEHVIKFDLPPAVRKQYEELEEEFLTQVGEELITAANAGSAQSKCRQICSGALYLPTVDLVTGAVRTTSARKADREWVVLHDEKLDALESLIDELQGQQLLVAYDFNHDLARLQKRFPRVPHLGGGVSGQKGAELEDAWNRGELPVLFGHPASMGHGLNLQKSGAHHVAWFTLTWDFELYDQLIRRLRRQGNVAQHIHVYHLIARNTVEDSVAYALRHKNRTQKTLLDALRSRKRAGR